MERGPRLDFVANMYANKFSITLPPVFHRDRLHRGSAQTERLTKHKHSVKPVCHSFFPILQPSPGTQTMRAISQPISKGSELLSAGAYRLDTQQNEVE